VISQTVKCESDEDGMREFLRSATMAEIEDKSRLPDELAVLIARRLDVGVKFEVAGWGWHAIIPLGVKRILDRYYDTPDRIFQTWSKAHGKQLLLRDRREGSIVSDVDPRNIHTQADMLRLPVEDEMHIWVVKVPLESANPHKSFREAREHEAPYTDQDREAVRAKLLSVIRQTLDLEFDPSTVDVREYLGKLRKTYAVFSRPPVYASQRYIATIAIDFIVREYDQPDGVFVERYAKYEAEK
jgi:hypothetical protein